MNHTIVQGSAVLVMPQGRDNLQRVRVYKNACRLVDGAHCYIPLDNKKRHDPSPPDTKSWLTFLKSALLSPPTLGGGVINSFLMIRFGSNGMVLEGPLGRILILLLTVCPGETLNSLSLASLYTMKTKYLFCFPHRIALRI